MISDAFNHAIDGTPFNISDTLINATFNSVLSIAFAGIMKNILNFPGVNSGRGSWSAITNQIYTKLKNDLIKNISLSTFGKMLGVGLYGSLLDIFYNGIKIKES